MPRDHKPMLTVGKTNIRKLSQRTGVTAQAGIVRLPSTRRPMTVEDLQKVWGLKGGEPK